MDFVEADELDYEEDELPNDAAEKSLQSKNCSENSNLFGSDDQYLQIDCPEEENFFSLDAPLDSVHPDTQNSKLGSEVGEKEKSIQQNFSSGKEQSPQTNAAISCKSNNKKKRGVKSSREKKKHVKSFIPLSEANENIFKDLNLGSRFPVSQNAVKPHRFSVCGNQQIILNRDFYWSKRSPYLPDKNLQQLVTVKSNQVPCRSLSSFSPTVTGGKRCGLPRRRNKPFSRNFSGSLFNKNQSKFKIEGKNVTLSEYPEPKIISENKNVKKISVFEQKLNVKNRKSQDNLPESSKTVEASRNFKRRTFPDKNSRGPGPDSTYGFVGDKNKNTFFDLQFNLLNDDEKKLVILKKEARLKRFSHEDTAFKERAQMDSALDEKNEKCLHLEKEYFEKMAEQKLTRERFFKLREQKIKNSNCDNNPNDRSVLLEKPNINKESLLKKKNPFDESLGSSGSLLAPKIKQESERGREIKRECGQREEDKVFALNNADSKMKSDDNFLSILGSSVQSCFAVKNETVSPVKFVRTVTKGFDELASKKVKTEVISKRNRNRSPFSFLVKTFDSVEGNETDSVTRNNPAQIESHLTGCIVKVLNIPPSTTTNDVLALCCPVGVVREVKLNFPKENSVVIRFVEPASAEKFFSLYHGQKMNNYFLNVIIV